MNRICKICGVEKEINEFVKRTKIDGVQHRTPAYRHKCKECENSDNRTHIPNKGKFEKGSKPLHPFKKGHIPWSKLNKGKYRLGRKSNKRNSLNYLEWVENVKNRDGNKCRECESIQYLEAHHIFSYSEFPEKRCDIKNGVTLCRACHKKVEYMIKKLKNGIIIWDKD